MQGNRIRKGEGNGAEPFLWGFHGDGGAFSKQDSLFTFSWNSLLGQGTTIDKRFVYTVVKKSDVIADTLPALLKLFSWSVNALLTGISPELDEDGQPCPGGGKYLADGWRAALCQIRGDLATRCRAFWIPSMEFIGQHVMAM